MYRSLHSQPSYATDSCIVYHPPSRAYASRGNTHSPAVEEFDLLPYTLCPKKQGTHIWANNFHKHRPISMPFDRIVIATFLDNLP